MRTATFFAPPDLLDMPRSYFALCDRASLRDAEGTELADFEAAREEALVTSSPIGLRLTCETR